MLLFSPLWAEDPEGLNESTEQYPFEQVDDAVTSYLEAKYDYDVTGRAKIRSPLFEGERIRYSDSEVDVYYTHSLGCESGITLGAGYSSVGIFWKKNPFFEENHFNNFILSLSGYTKLIPNWLWRGGVSSAVDTAEWNWTHYTIYNLTLWGRYTYCDNVGVHVGFIAQTGIRKDKVQPILGVDFKMYDDWKINLVYPVNISLVYTIAEQWSLALAARIMDSRQRVGKNEALSKGIFEYRNVGTELSLTYSPAQFASANIHIGSATGGSLKISNQNNAEPVYMKLKPVGYIGGAVDLKY